MNPSQKESILNIITSQTDYDRETADAKLKEWDNDFIKVIKEFLNPDFQKRKTRI